MKIEDYFKYYIQGSDHYLIPKDVFEELFDEMSNWKEEVKELKNYYKYLPNYWNKLKELQSKTDRPMKYNKYSVFDLEQRFKNE